MFSIFGLSQNWMSFLILVVLIAIVWIFDRKNFKREGIAFMRRTQRGLSFIDGVAKRHQNFWKRFGTLGIMLSFGIAGVLYVYIQQKKDKIMARTAVVFAAALAALLYVLTPIAAVFTSVLGAAGLIIMQLVMGAFSIFSRQLTIPPVQLVLPIQTTAAPVFYVPIDFWLISIFVIMVVHEFSHAFVARAENIRVKSIGYGFAAVVPIGFAEPDEAQLKKAESLKKSRVFAAGSLSNFFTGVIALLIYLSLGVAASAAFIPAGVTYAGTIEDSPAFGVLPQNGTITAINGYNVTAVGDISGILANVPVGSKLSVSVDGKDYELATAASKANATKSFVGISELKTRLVAKEKYAPIVGETFPSSLIWLLSLLNMLFTLNIGVGLVNILPIKPLDGGLMFDEITKCIWPKSGKSIYSIVAFTTLGLIFLNIFGVYIVRAVASVI